MDLYLFARFHAKPGRHHDLLAAIENVATPTRAEPGCLGYHIFHSVRDPGEFYIHSHWKNNAAFEHHASLPHTVSFIAKVEQLIDHPLTVSLTRQLQ